MKKFLVNTVYSFVLFLGAFSLVQAQENHFSFVFKENKDPTIYFGFRYGRMGLFKPVPPPGSSRNLRSSYENIPEYLGFANISLATHIPMMVCNANMHSLALISNLSVLRSTTMVGYVFSRPLWYVSTSFGYEVLRNREGEYSFAKTEFTKNVLVYQLEFGFSYPFKKTPWFTRGRMSVGYSPDGYGLFPQSEIFFGHQECFFSGLSISGGFFFDGLWGLGPSVSFELHNTTRLYIQKFTHHFEFQKYRFPEQRMGMTKGFAFGLLTEFN